MKNRYLTFFVSLYPRDNGTDFHDQGAGNVSLEAEGGMDWERILAVIETNRW